MVRDTNSGYLLTLLGEVLPVTESEKPLLPNTGRLREQLPFPLCLTYHFLSPILVVDTVVLVNVFTPDINGSQGGKNNTHTRGRYDKDSTPGI